MARRSLQRRTTQKKRMGGRAALPVHQEQVQKATKSKSIGISKGKCTIIHYEFQEGKNHDFSPVANHIKSGKPVFAIFYMQGCGPCEAARPEWNKLKKIQHELPQHALLLEIDHLLKDKLYESIHPSYAEIKNISSFPTITLMHNGKMHPYTGPERKAEHFREWIGNTVKKTVFGGRKTRRKRL